jgi:hypothetical protein
MLTLATSWLADVAPDPVSRTGEALAPHKKTQIEMTAEVVTITLGSDDARVKAVFQLKNTGKEGEKLEVGFPTAVMPGSYTWSSEKVDVHTWGDATIRDFKASVDGKEVKAEAKHANQTKEYFIRGWLCWAMEFDAGQERTVEVSYRFASRDDNYTASSPLRNRQATYILRSGAGWKGNIGSAKVILEFGDITGSHITKAAPEPTSKEKGSWTWQWKDWEPDTDILLQYRVYADAKEAVAKLADVVSKKPEDGDALLDLADNQLELKSWEDAAKTLEKLGALEDTKKAEWTRGRSEWVSPWFRAAEAWMKAEKKDAAKPCAEKAMARIQKVLDQLEKGDSFYVIKGLRTSREHLLGQLDDCRSWLK